MPTLDTWDDALLDNGWAVSTSLLEPSFWQALDRLKHSTAEQSLMAAGTGKGASFQAQSVRGDRIHWLEGHTPDEATVLAGLDRLRQALREMLRLPLNEVEAHLAYYPPGAGYAKHLDAFQHNNARLVSLVCYLNPQWEPGHGGCLRLHLEQGPVDVPPVWGASAIFLSEAVEHEVLPSSVDRWSLACWFRR